jgi:hypothetical protein
MKAEAIQHRRCGRPTTRRDKNGRSVPIRADRDAPLKFFFENVPRARLDDALQMSGDKRFFRLYDALHDEAYRNTSPGTLCRKFGISWLDLIELWRQYNVDLGLMRMATHLPEVMEDVVQDALSRDVACECCDGIGSVTGAHGQGPCSVCEGRGKVRVPGDEHARQLVLKIYWSEAADRDNSAGFQRTVLGATTQSARVDRKR